MVHPNLIIWALASLEGIIPDSAIVTGVDNAEVAIEDSRKRALATPGALNPDLTSCALLGDGAFS